MSQIGIPVDISLRELTREKTLGDALGLCAKVAGYEPKEVCDLLNMDKHQWSRWQAGQEGVMWPKFTALMDKCGNDAPLLWMVHTRGYDVNTLRKVETELQRQLRAANDRISALEAEREITIRTLREVRA